MAAPVFDTSAISSVVSSQANTLPISWSHASIGAGANNCGIVAVVDSNNNFGNFVPTGTPTASIGATSLTYLNSVKFNNNGALGFIAVWAGLLVPTGTQTVTTSIASAGQTNSTAYGASFIYTGVGSFGTLQTGFGSSTAPSKSVPSATGDLVWGLIGNWFNDVISSFSLTSRRTQTNAPYFIAGDGAGATSVAVSGTIGTTREWGAVGLDLLPVGGVAAPIGKLITVKQAVQSALR